MKLLEGSSMFKKIQTTKAKRKDKAPSAHQSSKILFNESTYISLLPQPRNKCYINLKYSGVSENKLCRICI